MKVERNRLLIAYYLEGHTIKETGEKFGVTRGRVQFILRREGIKPRKYTRIRPPSPPKPLQTFSERFWSLVQIGSPTDCWTFLGVHYPNGYGKFSGLGRQFLAHRLAFLLARRRSPKQWVLHRCDNPPCVNPDHLYDGTPVDNARDCHQRGRAAHLADPEGFRAKVSEGMKRYLGSRAKATG